MKVKKKKLVDNLNKKCYTCNTGRYVEEPGFEHFWDGPLRCSACNVRKDRFKRV